QAALDTWRTFLDAVNTLRDECGMGVLLIAHAEIRRFDSPETEPYDRYQPKLHRSASALVQEHVDAVLFANYRISTLKSDVGFNKKVVRGVGGGDRLLHTIERPAFLAKNRFGLEETLPLAWADLAAGIPFYAAAPSTPVIPTQDTGN
ncbi:MAG: AAA family ATPase, partial [Roseomonas sp.]|nr:AAA family ATPase [Roseomonas sp.]